MAKHRKLKVKVIKDINENSNVLKYKIGDILDVQEIKKESLYYEIVSATDIDMIEKSCVEIVDGK